jgi:hypothetical protein
MKHPYNYLKQKIMPFFFYKNREEKGKTGPVWKMITSRSGEDVRKGEKRVNMVEIVWAHICKRKNETYINYSSNGGKRKGECWRGCMQQ